MPLTDLLTKLTIEKKISLNQIVNLVVLVVAILIAVNINKGQNKKIAQIRQIQNEQREKNEILLRVGDIKKKNDLYKETFKPIERRKSISAIGELAKLSGVKIISIRPQAKARAGVGAIYNKILFQLNIEVDGYHQLGKFISRLEKNPMIFGIELLRIKVITRATTVTKPADKPEKLGVELTISELLFEG